MAADVVVADDYLKGFHLPPDLNCKREVVVQENVAF